MRKSPVKRDARSPKELQEHLIALVRQVGDKPIPVESSVFVPEGLLITFKTNEDAVRMLTLLKLLTPEPAHVLYKIVDTRLLLKTPPVYPAVMPEE